MSQLTKKAKTGICLTILFFCDSSSHLKPRWPERSIYKCLAIVVQSNTLRQKRVLSRQIFPQFWSRHIKIKGNRSEVVGIEPTVQVR